MGIAIRQSTKYSVLNYLGAVLGILSTLFVYPRALESYGLVRWFMDVAALVAPFVMLGGHVLAIKYFSQFQVDQRRNPISSLLLVWVAVGILFFTILWFLFQGPLDRFFQNQNPLRGAYYQVIYPLTIASILTTLLVHITSNYHRIVVPSILQEIMIKITLPLVLLGSIYWSWSMNVVVYGVVLNYAIAVIGLFVYLFYLGGFRDLDFRIPLAKVGLKPMMSYALFGLLSSLGSLLALRIDRVMVGYMLGDRINGIFSIVVTLGIFLEIPLRSVLKISSPMVSKAIANDQFSEVDHIYKRTSLTLMVIGAVLFTGIWWLLDEVFQFMPGGEAIAEGKYVIFYYGLAVWVNMITSVNSEIIGFSRFYRLNFYTFMLLAVLNVAMNWTFIKLFGMVGASIATLVSLSLFNAVKSGFIWWKFRIHPFSRGTWQTLLLLLICWTVIWLIPWPEYIWTALVLKGLFILIFFGAGIIWLNLSPEIVSVIRDPRAVFFPGKKNS